VIRRPHHEHVLGEQRGQKPECAARTQPPAGSRTLSLPWRRGTAATAVGIRHRRLLGLTSTIMLVCGW
jgi:hypothetical protein